MFKSKILLSAISFLLLSSQSFAQSAFEVETDVAHNIVMKYPYYPSWGMSDQMLSQIETGGCIPRGMGLADSRVSVSFSFRDAILAKGQEVKIRFRFCEDPLAFILPSAMRVNYGISGVGYPANSKDKLSSRNNLSVSLVDPAGQNQEITTTLLSLKGTTSSYYRSVGYAMIHNGYPVYVDTNQAGVYELVIKNSSAISIKAGMSISIYGNAVSQ